MVRLGRVGGTRRGDQVDDTHDTQRRARLMIARRAGFGPHLNTLVRFLQRQRRRNQKGSIGNTSGVVVEIWRLSFADVAADTSGGGGVAGRRL